MVTGVCENQFAAARKLLILQRRDAGAVDQARLESVRFQCGSRAYEPAKVGSSRGKARWRKGPAAPTASDVLRGRSRREGHRCVSPSPLIEPDVDHLGHSGSRTSFTRRHAQRRAPERQRRHDTPSSPTTTGMGNRRWPDPAILCRPGVESGGGCGTGGVPHRAVLS